MIIWMKTQIKCQHPALRLHERSAWVTVAWRTQPASLASCLEPPRPILLGTPACFSLPSPRSPMLQLYHPQRSGFCHPIPSLSHHPDTFLPSASPSLLNGSSPTLLGFPGSASDKNPPASAGDGRHSFHPWGRKIPWRREWQPTPVSLPGESCGQRHLAGCSPWGRKESDSTEAT